MPDNVRRLAAAGFDMAQVAKLMTDGYTPAGITGSISAGFSAALKRMYGGKAINVALPEPTVVTVTGDDTRLAVFSFDPENLPNFPLTVGEMDADIVNATQGTNIYTVGTYYDFSPIGPVNRDFPDMTLLISSQAKSRVSGNKGSGFHNTWLPRVQMTYLGRNYDERGAATFTWQVQVDTFDTFPWGGLIGNNAFGKNEAVMFEWFTNKRPQLLTIVDNTSTDTYQLDSVPWADGNGNIRFIAWRNGVVIGSTGNTTLVSVSANKTVDLTALTGRTSGDKIVIFAEVA